jgi:probable DNA repair protein
MRIACRELPGWFAQPATIVTPTPFLAAVAREQFVRERLKQGLETWDRPAIYSMDAWLVTRWQEARYTLPDVPSLLSPAQETALWHAVIEEEHPNLFDITATVRLARTAASLIAEWNIPSQGEAWNDHADALQFQLWYRSFRRRCDERKWITRAQLPRLVAAWIASGELPSESTLFVGFESTSPALESIIVALGSRAIRLPLDHAKPAKKAISKGFDCLPDEIDFAARRLRLLFEENPTRSMALFVPDLMKRFSLVQRTLHSVFFPSIATKLTAPQNEPPFRLSTAGLLIEQPVVSAALLLLNLACPRIDHADAGSILRSPFIAGAKEERNARALADIELRRQRELDVRFADIEKASSRCPVLTASWQKLSNLLPKTQKKRALSEWSELISDFLAAVGWPGDKDLTPGEEAMIERWKNQLSELSSLGLVSPPVSFDAVIAHLNRLLSVRLEHGEWAAPIQVLDAELAMGVEFDSAIAIDVSEETWPAPVRISPLVPLKLQRQYQVPASTIQGSREERVRKTKALFEAAPDVLVTYTERLASVATAFVAKKSQDVSLWEGQLPNESYPIESLEQLPDGQAPAFVAIGEVRGGTNVIKAQSQCPFQAFAKYRLNARRPEDASFGFDALDRGSFVHKSLEFVWRRLQSSQNLKRLPLEDLKNLVSESIAEAVKSNDSGPLHQLSVETERERLQEVIFDWLEQERGRVEDFTVETIEQEQKFEVPGLSLKLRVDRIDRLNNGNLVLIDYKSGKQTRPKLEGERPAEPQLLVYAASVDAVVDGVFFGQLKPREVKAVGFSRTKQFKGQTAEAKKDWETYIEKSRENVANLANEFVRGVAEVHPTGAPCGFCGMKPFCRINEKGAAQEEEE